ncbi:Arginine exporter protein ArgO [Nocardioides aquaticus]|uniref:Arginine exporter protein ArgO n=1 Tax=Nocardioides aquaticus TaxID=160826 RepID=A0ABX8EMV4_9ACTN|nr:LysE/ArgO family amino acid transporter [Nocardioides aquaticus]QVT81854.1 Arginine exporter protein ArgO [Nocardioides aquaticus]
MLASLLAPATAAATATLTGLVTGLALIVAIGAQNAFVLRQGLARAHVGAVVAICLASDAVLIMAGVAGVGALVQQAGWLLEVVRWGGVAFLAVFGLLSLRRAARPDVLRAAESGAGTRRRAVLTALALTWLNPHVYLDTVLFLGSVATTQGPDERWWFGLGAVLGSAVWFLGLGYGAHRAHRLLSRPRSWQVLDALIGVVMLLLAVTLARTDLG